MALEEIEAPGGQSIAPRLGLVPGYLPASRAQGLRAVPRDARPHGNARGSVTSRSEHPAASNHRGDGDSRDETITRLFDEHYKGLCRLAGLLLGDSAGAEEVVQEAFLRTFSGWWRVRHPERAQWYLRKSVVNLCRSRLRRRVTEDRGNRITWAENKFGEEADSSGLSDEAILLVAHVRRLPPRQRDAVVLRYYEDLPEAEIARVLGCAVGTVKSQLAKARATLARGLEDDTTGDGSGSDLGSDGHHPEEGGSGA
jgi:RNA polymerase sigma-70 factor (sigma-E family)